jgi:NAD(P)-dependent dehydrogenase (short-subunit alcohol dehydrogenase family)
MKLNFSGRTALITGGSGGIGLSIVKKLIKNKIKVIILDINTPSKKILLNKFIEFKKIDLSDYKNLQLCLTELKKKYKKIEYVINAAGVLWFDKDVSLEKIEINTWDKVFSINLNSIVIVLQSILPQMKKNEFGSIVHISSIDALSGDNKPQDAYGSSKAALLRLSKSISIQFADKNIRSNSILPGPIETPMQERWKKNPESKKNLSNVIPLRRVGKPGDIASSTMFLLSDESSFITGTELIVDGGLRAKP